MRKYFEQILLTAEFQARICSKFCACFYASHRSKFLICTIYLTCDGKPWPWRVQRWVKLLKMISCQMFKKSLRQQKSSWRFVRKNAHAFIPVTEDCFWPAILIRRALESPDPGASSNGSNLQTRHFGADLVTFEVSSENPSFGKFVRKWREIIFFEN